jgi:hypothetical protein
MWQDVNKPFDATVWAIWRPGDPNVGAYKHNEDCEELLPTQSGFLMNDVVCGRRDRKTVCEYRI